jgi:hypothetical protein
VSDLLSVSYGSESLRYALLMLTCVNIWTAFHYFMAGRTLQADLVKAKRTSQ